MRFTRAYAATNCCSPTRGAFLTGKAPARTHLPDWIPGWCAQEREFPMLAPIWTKYLALEHTTITEALDVIKEYLYANRQYVSVAAGNVADRIGEQARPIRHIMEDVIKVSAAKSADRSNFNTRYFLFVDWLLSHALRELDENKS